MGITRALQVRMEKQLCSGLSSQGRDVWAATVGIVLFFSFLKQLG